MRSLSGGFSMKSKAPSFVASTAVLTVPWPERITTGGAASRSLSRFSTSRPSICGILMSRKHEVRRLLLGDLQPRRAVRGEEHS